MSRIFSYLSSTCINLKNDNTYSNIRVEETTALPAAYTELCAMAQPSHQLRRKNLISPEMGGGEKKEINTMCRKVVSCESQVTVSILSSTVSDHFFLFLYSRKGTLTCSAL